MGVVLNTASVMNSSHFKNEIVELRRQFQFAEMDLKTQRGAPKVAN